MKFQTKQVIKSLEEHIEQGYSLKIFKGYIAVNKRGVEKMINAIYSSLSIDVQNAQQYLETKDKNNYEKFKDAPSEKKIYKYLKELDSKLANAIKFTDYAVLNIKEIEKILDKIYKNIPEEVIEAEHISEE